MNIEDLLIPRYEVRASWPQGHYKKGDIITGNETKVLECEKYHELFALLWWNELREESELPEYIKIRRPAPGRHKGECPIVLKTTKVHNGFPSIGENSADVEYEYEGDDWKKIQDVECPMSGYKNVVGVSIRRYDPATEEEYLEDIERINKLKK